MGRVARRRLVFLAQVKAATQFDAGSHPRAAHCRYEHEGPTSRHPAGSRGRPSRLVFPGRSGGRGRRARAACRAGRGAGSGRGGAGGVRAGAARVQAGPAAAGGPGLCGDHHRAAGAGRLVAQLGVTRVVMESTSAYWKGVYWLLEAEGFECWLVNAREVKNVPGRPKTDKADAVWLAKVAERAMCRPSLVQPRPIRQLRDLT